MTDLQLSIKQGYEKNLVSQERKHLTVSNDIISILENVSSIVPFYCFQMFFGLARWSCLNFPFTVDIAD